MLFKESRKDEMMSDMAEFEALLNKIVKRKEAAEQFPPQNVKQENIAMEVDQFFESPNL